MDDDAVTDDDDDVDDDDNTLSSHSALSLHFYSDIFCGGVILCCEWYCWWGCVVVMADCLLLNTLIKSVR